jgi:hypothetical protein
MKAASVKYGAKRARAVEVKQANSGRALSIVEYRSISDIPRIP